jgi:hypothetical protein
MTFPLDIEGTWFNTGVSLDAGELRRADSGIFAGGAGLPLGVGAGVVRHSDTSLAVTIDGSDVVTVQPGAVVIPGNAVTGTGPYRAAVSTATTGSVTARNATNARIDLVVFRALDTDVVPGHGAYKTRVEIIAGTPSATPAVPTLPTMAVELARITVPNTGGGTATVDSSKRTYATAIGGELVVPTSTQLPASAAKYQRARSLATGLSYMYSGSVWVADPVTPFAMAAGNDTISGTSVASGGTTTTTITFPVGRFTQPPIVTCTLSGFVTGSAFAIVRQVDTITTSTARAVVANFGPTAATFTALPFQWHAVQMTSSNAEG